MKIQTRDQRYAKDIFERVQKFKQDHSDDIPDKIKQRQNKAKWKQYGSMAHKLPVLIRTAGLAQALAFAEVSGKKKTPHQRLLNDLAQTVLPRNAGQFVELSRSAPLGEYMQLTQNALSALLWYKRFAQSVLGVEAGDEPETEEEAG